MKKNKKNFENIEVVMFSRFSEIVFNSLSELNGVTDPEDFESVLLEKTDECFDIGKFQYCILTGMDIIPIVNHVLDDLEVSSYEGNKSWINLVQKKLGVLFEDLLIAVHD